MPIDCPREQCKFTNCTAFKEDHFKQYKSCYVEQKRCDTAKKLCGFWFNEKLKISCLSNAKFSVLVRREGKRELLVLPALSNHELHDNIDLSKSKEFWAHVLQVRHMVLYCCMLSRDLHWRILNVSKMFFF